MNRRFFLRGLVAAPAVVAIGSLMPIRGLVMRPPIRAFVGWVPDGGYFAYAPYASEEDQRGMREAVRILIEAHAEVIGTTQLEVAENSFPRSASIRPAATRIERLSARQWSEAALISWTPPQDV